MLRAGASDVIITPPVGGRLDGYGSRTAPSVRVHDDLHARAVVVDDGQTTVAIVSCDLIGVDRRLVAAARSLVVAATGIPAAHVMVSATHTHGGPAGLRSDADAALTETTARAIAGAVIAAHASLRPAVIKAGRGSVDSVSQNRRDPAGPADSALQVVLFDAPDPQDGAIAAIVNFACHATVMFETNLEISADYPGYAAETVSGILGGDVPVLFLNGACGDVNPSWIEQRFDEARRVGSIVGAEAARRLQELRPLGAVQRTWNIRWNELTENPVRSGKLIEPRLRVASEQVDVAMRSLPPPEEYDRRMTELRTALDARLDVPARRNLTAELTRLQGERAVAARMGPGGARRLAPEIQAIAFGSDCAVLGLPGEFFAETGMAIRAEASLPNLLIACYSNHYLYYVVPHHAFDEGGYEPGVAVVDEHAEPAFRAAAARILREVTA